MSKEKQILHMLLDGYSQRRIASTLCVSRNTVAKVAKAASDHQLSKDALESMEEMEIHNTLFPEEALLPTLVTPDFPYIHKELLKSGVTLKLLWQEYVDTCRDAGESAVAAKVELAGRVAVLVLSMPSIASYIRIMSPRTILPCISSINLVTN